MKPCYINSVGCISAQSTFDNSEFLEEPILQESNVLPIVPPPFKNYISRAASRRMAKGVKMGIVAATIALQEAGIEQPDAIITGTGLGCLQDSEKFLESILDNDEEYLSPTAFIQSTHNTVGAQVALGLKCPAYNLTYVHGSVSFESAILDAFLMLEEADKEEQIVVGGIEELGKHTTNLFQLIEHIKAETPNTKELLNSKSKGTIFSEGAQFFVLSNQAQESTYAKVIDLETISRLKQEKLEERLLSFLNKNELTTDDIDVVVLGNNGDVEFDSYYHALQNGLFQETSQVYYKHLSGEYLTVSAFGMWVAAKILKTQKIPEILYLNKIPSQQIQRILLYNQYRGEGHGFMLMEGCTKS
jgi:3-oxoacyl-(acyl-carrier-protein) synthase